MKWTIPTSLLLWSNGSMTNGFQMRTPTYIKTSSNLYASTVSLESNEENALKGVDDSKSMTQRMMEKSSRSGQLSD